MEILERRRERGEGEGEEESGMVGVVFALGVLV